MKQVYFTNSDKPKKKFRKSLIVIIALAVLTCSGILAYQLTPSDDKDNSGVTPQKMLKMVETPEAQAQEKTEGKGKETKDNSESADNSSGSAEEEEAQSSNKDEKDARIYTSKQMKAIEKEIVKSLRATRELQRALEDTLAKEKANKDKDKRQRLAKLIKIMNSMRAEDAAEVIPKMDEDLAVQILSALSGAKSSKIMGNLPPAKAAKLSSEMVKLNPDIKLREVMTSWKDIVEEIEKDKKENTGDDAKRYDGQQ